MSLYGVLRTGVSGMNAQSNKLGTVADNIANANTVGYKRASAEFSSLVLSSGKGSYNSGSVVTNIRYSISQQGPLVFTTSSADLAVQGNGFFVVSDEGGTPYLTRAGSFVPDSEGNLVNTAGYYLMGYPLTNGNPNVTLNSLDGLERVNLANLAMSANPTTQGSLGGNLPIAAAAGDTFQSSLIVYDNVGNKVQFNVTFEKTTNFDPLAPANQQWQVTIDGVQPAGWTAGPFTLTFDTSGQIVAGAALTPINIPNGQAMTLDLSGMQQLASDYAPLDPIVNGNAPSQVDKVEFGKDGTVYAVYEDGTRIATYRIPLANVPSPDKLTPEAGNVYSASIESGNVQVGFPGQAGLGSILSGALEQSNVDMGEELTAMIEAQRNYTANSKVFQTGSELLDVLMNLKR
ncbi:flagellar hook-basal body protein [Chelatococcus sambhunathii]|uniref:Flagellar hook protein FlgE n=2 Tax=Chelatococcus TaxID=28209 RepID=A0AAC9JRF1_9HYPH|nr:MULTISPECIES: flagellar hook protein FlgE [Chelatococcus]APF38458.1 flagellar hook protein FlgE [Chelatococcus daeguensis]CUA85114.1 flagellar hook-basal body protein [Chelatococcus sambhunathii]